MHPSPSIVPRLDLMAVEDVMHAGLVGCDPASSVASIARFLAEEQIHCLLVQGIEHTRGGDRLTWGIVSDRDLMRALDAPEAGVTAAELAATAMPTVEPRETLDRAVQLMVSHDVTHIIVVENDYPVGIVSALDVARTAGGV
jgi:CBS domain-containing protein